MSYAFTVYGETKVELLRQLAERVTTTARAQPIHRQDVNQALIMADRLLERIDEVDGKALACSINGHITTRYPEDDDTAPPAITALRVEVAVYLVHQAGPIGDLAPSRPAPDILKVWR